jgi:integrase
MGSGDMRVRYPGLIEERMPSGNSRWRVRIKGKRANRIPLPFGPEHPDFHAIYTAARDGIAPAKIQRSDGEPGMLEWLGNKYLAHLRDSVAAGAASPLTLKERTNLCAFVMAQVSEQPRSLGRRYGTLPLNIPEAELIAFKDRMAATPGKALNVWKFLTAMYDFGMKRSLCRSNPARAVARPTYRSQGGATPWTSADLEAFRDPHPPGTMAHLALSLFMFTACRISDAIWLGREQEERHNGRLWLAWQPGKKGSRFVRLPVLAPLERAIRAQTVVGPAYLLTEAGKPFASPEALRNRMQKWCATAGLADRSSHGIRKAAGHLLALHGATQYEIMAVHGHANASTLEVYTATVERMRLGEMAVSRLSGMEW